MSLKIQSKSSGLLPTLSKVPNNCVNYNVNKCYVNLHFYRVLLSRAYMKLMKVEDHVSLVAGNFTEKLPEFE